jgi:uncharacterized membrane protein
MIIKIVLFILAFICSIGICISLLFVFLKIIRYLKHKPKIVKNDRYKIENYTDFLKQNNL